MKLNHAQVQWLKMARREVLGFVAQDRKSLRFLVSLGYLTRINTPVSSVIARWRVTNLGLQKLGEIEREEIPLPPRMRVELGKRELDMLCVAKIAGRGCGFSMHSRSTVLQKLLSLGLVEENMNMPVSRWWRITEAGERALGVHNI